MADIMELFCKILDAEKVINDSNARISALEMELLPVINAAEKSITEAWAKIESEMKATGEYEVLLNGSITDYKISWSTPRERIKADPEATPDEFCKIERKPMLKEIGGHLKGLQSEGKPLPNWASIEKGDPKLQWKAVKKTAKA